MTCRELIEFLDDYRAGRLSSPERRRFQEHLEICPDCVTYLETYGTAVELARAAASDPVPPEVPEDLVRAILASRKPA